MKRRILSAIITTALTLSALTLSACRSEKSPETTDLMTGIKAASHETVKPDDAFKSAYDNFSVELLKKCFDGKSNTLISPPVGIIRTHNDSKRCKRSDQR